MDGYFWHKEKKKKKRLNSFDQHYELGRNWLEAVNNMNPGNHLHC